jgi:hypothetical protein
MRIMQKFSSTLLALAIPGLLISCSGDQDDTKKEPPAKTATALALTAGSTNLALGLTVQLVATVTYDDASTEDVTRLVTWVSSNDQVATVSTESEVAGLVVTAKEGSTKIGAQFGALIEYVDFEVAPPDVVSLDIESAKGVTLGIGQSVQLSAWANRTDNTRADITKDVVWTCSDGSVALLNNASDKGFLTTKQVTGMIMVTAALGDISSNKEFEITDSVLLTLELSADPRRIEVGSQTIVQAEGTYTDGSKRNLTALVTWATSDMSVAAVSDRGVVTANERGSAVITATSDNNVVANLSVSTFEQGDCDYPEPFDRIKLGETMPKLIWEDALLADETPIFFSMEQFACAEQWQQYTSVVFVVSTGWCPYCPAYNKMVSDQAADLAAAGMLVVFCEAETSSRQPPTSQQAFDIVANWDVDGPGIRIGDGATEPLPFAIKAWASAYPSAFVVRSSDMKVLNVNPRQGGGLMPIAQHPENY